MTINRTINVGNHGYNVEYPDECPICHHHSEIKVIQTRLKPSNIGVQVIFQCAFSNCGSYFLGYYGPRPSPELLEVKPQKPKMDALPDSVRKLSPDFVSIYEEAEEALHLGLSQIAGPGYRKAFEFLVKDYAKSLQPERAEEIEKKFSGNVVTEFVVDPRISAVAERALWLGNDESHYLKKWEKHDINDLITLIRLCINWIEIERLSYSYTSEMRAKDA